MRASLLIAAHNEGELLLKTLRACVESVGRLDYEIVVSDDASTDGSVERAQKAYPQVRVVRGGPRAGASPAKHRAAEAARGEVLVFLDGHTNPEFGAIERLVQDVEAVGGDAVVTPAVPNLETGRWMNARGQVGHGYALSLETLACRWVGIGSMTSREVGGRRLYETPALIGCAAAVGRGLYRELWGFDAGMQVWGVEDVDFGLKCWLMGYPVLHDPRAVVGHRFRTGFDTYGVPGEHVVANQLRFARKHFTSAVWEAWVEGCRRRSDGPLAGHPEGLWARAWQVFEEGRASVEQERRYLQGRRVHDEFWYAERFGLAWPRLAGRGPGVSAATSSLLLTSPSPSPAPEPPKPREEAPCTAADPQCLCDGECGCESSCGGGAGECLADPSTGVNGECSAQASEETSIQFVSGQIRLDATDIKSDGFGAEWGHTRVYSNTLSYDGDVGQGYNWLVFQWPYLVLQDDGSIVLVRGTLGSLWFDPVEEGFEARYCAKAKLVYDDERHVYVVVLAGGTTLEFHDFVQTSYPQGLFMRRILPAGQTTEVVNYTIDGRIEEVQRSGTVGASTLLESFLYTYTADAQVETLVLRRKLGSGSWDNVRRAVYDYYGVGSSFGSVGDLQRVRIQAYVSSSWQDLEATAYRYWLDGDPEGFAHALKFVINPLTYARMVGASLNPLTAADSVVQNWADHYYEFDADRRVVLTRLKGGTEETTLEYEVTPTPGGPNDWHTGTTLTLPDGSTVIVITNKLGQILLVDRNNNTSAKWLQAYEYNACYQLVRYAHPSAVEYYDFEPKDNSFVYYLYTDQGLIDLIEYYGPLDTAPGYVKHRQIQHGTSGTPILVQMYEYTSATAGLVTIHPVSKRRVYRDEAGTETIDTTYAYTYFTGTVQIQQVTTTWPTVTTGQNGPNSATVRYDVHNEYCQPIWAKDEEEYLDYRAYDLGTGALVKSIRDVDTTQTGEFTAKPTGWTTPTGGGLNLIMLYEVDNMGRATKRTYPNGVRVDYAVFKDVDHETRYYPGWSSSSSTVGTTTGPTRMSRQDRARNYGETLTMSATPTVSGGRPTGAESVANVQSLSRGLFDQVGDLVYQDQYFDLTGTSYSTNPAFGTAGVNYYRTTYEYDERDRLVRTLTPQGTISRTAYDFLSRTVNQSTGTDDSAMTSNMVTTVAYEYDDGGVGDGNLTKTTQIPSGGAADRVTRTWFDWRDRSVATKSGVQGTETDPVHRPIGYVDYDNLNRVVKSRRYDGDGVTITVTGGVPQPPSSSLLRAQSETLYDELGRVYQSKTYSVDPSSGTVSSTALTTNTYYTKRGQAMATSAPGGLWSKSAYDGAGRTTAGYTTDGATGTSWANAGSIASDHVLAQTETAYDGNGNVLKTTSRQRFDGETGTGILGTPSSGVLARVYYMGYYYDRADRLTDSVNVGTNTISGTPTAWTRPGSVPSRSDTVLVNSTSYDAAGRVLDGTDPRGLVLRRLYDLAGRTTTTIEDYTNSTPGDANDKTTRFTYNSAGVTTLKAVLAGGTDHQTTGWVYGVANPPSEIDSEEIAAVTQYPDPSTGNPSSGEEESITVNALGQTLTITDRNGTVHTYTYDVLGRLVKDAVTTLGGDVDGAVRRRETAYDTQGNAYLFTTYTAASGGSVVNQVQREFNGLGQLITEYQEHAGAVNTGTSPKVQYAYSEMASSANHSRLTMLTYPNGREVSYDYASGLDNAISRLTAMIDDDSTVLENYLYLGLGTVVRRGNPQPDVDLTYIKLSGEGTGDAGDKYTGLDRFGRVVDQRWLDGGDVDLDRYQYTYDRDSNRLTRTNVLAADFNEVYTYDDLNQISTFDRSSLLSQSWEYDAVGNWATFDTDGTPQTRTHNRLNEITSISGLTTPVYDDNGNMTADENGQQYVYDAWNFAVAVLDSGNNPLAAYTYDALNRRTLIGNTSGETNLFYSSVWQVLEETGADVATVQAHCVWSPVYVDCMVLRDRSVGGTLDERLYTTNDANYNVTALIDTSGQVVERYAYTPFGVALYMDAAWADIGTSAYGWIYLHQGGRRSDESRLYNFRNRDYSAILGRWMTNDPLGFRGSNSNMNVYLRNNPIRRLDSTGLSCRIWIHCWPVDRGLIWKVTLGTHCGITIMDGKGPGAAGQSTFDGTGGGVNQIEENNGMKNVTYQPGQDYDDSVCDCIRKYKNTFNAYKFPREHLRGNSNWTLSCMISACGLNVDLGKIDPKPTAYDVPPCLEWEYEWRSRGDREVKCLKGCKTEAKCPPSQKTVLGGLIGGAIAAPTTPAPPRQVPGHWEWPPFDPQHDLEGDSRTPIWVPDAPSTPRPPEPPPVFDPQHDL